MSRFCPLRGRGMGVCNTSLRPGMCGPSKNCPVFVPFGAVCGAYSIRPYDRIRAILRNTDAILQLGTCEGSKNGSVYATVGGVWWGVCNTSLRPGTCEGSKNGSVFATVGGVWWGVCDTPLQAGTCCPSKNCPVFVPFGAVCGAYCIRPYDRIRAIFRNTDAMPQPGMCDSSKYRCDSPTGYVRSYEILIRSLDRGGGGVWDVGRWGLPFAGEMGVNEFGEEEDDDQDYNNEGARGDLQHKRQP